LTRILMLAAIAAGAAGSGLAQTGTSTTPRSRLVTVAGQPATSAADLAAAPAAGPAPAAASDTKTPGSTTAEDAPESRIEQEIAVLKARIDQLEKEIKEERTGAAEGASDAAALSAAGRELADGSRAGGNSAPVVGAPISSAAAGPAGPQAANPQAEATPAAPTASDPHAPAFSDWDWTWLNGNPRNKDTAYDSKFFTPEIRADINYTYDFSRPIDDTNSGSSEIFRNDEIQLAQLGVGGDFHLDHAHARFMTQYGMYSTATVRNDPSYATRASGMLPTHSGTFQRRTAGTISPAGSTA
jgi:hypothetical protein